jgi:hypothetical protein
MKLNVKRSIWTLALAAGIGLGGGVTQAVAAPFFQQQDQAPAPDYSHNKTYQQGQREGQADRAKNLDHSKKRHFKKNDDQTAYEAGYQKGRGN